MTTPTSDQFKLTLEQRQKLGHVYLLILDWRQERERKKMRVDKAGSQNAVPHSQLNSEHQRGSTKGES